MGDFSKGLNSHISDTNTPDNQANDALNVRFNDRYSALAKREVLLTVHDIGSEAITGLHRYYKSDGTTKTIITYGTNITVGNATDTGKTIIDAGLTDGKKWQFFTYKDVAIGLNGYDRPIKWDGNLTVTANTTGSRTANETCADLGAPFAELFTGANLTAAKWYQYKVMFGDGTTTYYSNARSNPLLTGADVKDIHLTYIPIGPVGTTYRQIYRTLGNATQAGVEACTAFYMVKNITNNTALNYTDQMSDATAGGETAWSITSKYECSPPIGKYGNIHKEKFWITGNTTYKSDIYFSDDANPDFFDPDSYEVIRADDGDEITFAKTFLGILTVGKTNTIQKYYTESNTSEWYVSDPFSFVGCPAPYSVDVTPKGIIYTGRNGLYLFDGGTSQLISDAVTPEIRDISQADISDTSGIYFNNEYRLAYTSSSAGRSFNDRVLVYDLVRDAYTIDTENISCWAALNSGSDFGVLYSGSSASDGYVMAHSPTTSSLIKRYKSELDLGTFNDTLTEGTEEYPIVKLGWDCKITNDTVQAGWLTELQSHNANITNISSIATYMPNATFERPDLNGSWTSPTYQVNASVLDKLYWNENLNTFGDVEWQIRSNATSDLTLTSWNTSVTNPNGADIANFTASNFIQLRANLSTSNISYSPELYQTDGYVFKILYSRVGSANEDSVLSLYKTGFKDFGVTGYKKMIQRVKTYYTGTEGNITINIKCDDGDIDKNITFDLSVNPDDFTTDQYTGEGSFKVYTFLSPINNETDPSLIGHRFQYAITENGVKPWTIDRIETKYELQEEYD